MREQWQSFRWAWQKCGMQEFRHPRGSRPLYQHVEDFAADQTIPPLDGGAPQISPGTAQTVCSGEWFSLCAMAQTVCMGEWFSLCAMACELCTARWHGSNRLYGRRFFIVCSDRSSDPSSVRATVGPTVRTSVRPSPRASDRSSDRPTVRPTVRPSPKHKTHLEHTTMCVDNTYDHVWPIRTHVWVICGLTISVPSTPIAHFADNPQRDEP